MPQFETAWYIGEIFWMLLCFGFLYLGVAYFIFPLIQDVFFEREHIVKNDLTMADVVNKQAEKLIQDYKNHIYSAEQAKAEIINETYQDIQKFSTHVEAEHEEIFRRQVEETEKKMQQIKSVFTQKSDDLAVQIAAQLADKLSRKPTGRFVSK